MQETALWEASSDPSIGFGRITFDPDTGRRCSIGITTGFARFLGHHREEVLPIEIATHPWFIPFMALQRFTCILAVLLQTAKFVHTLPISTLPTYALPVHTP